MNERTEPIAPPTHRLCGAWNVYAGSCVLVNGHKGPHIDSYGDPFPGHASERGTAEGLTASLSWRHHRTHTAPLEYPTVTAHTYVPNYRYNVCQTCGYAADHASHAAPDPIATIDTPSLRRMADRAYRDAVRCMQEYRAEPRTSPIRAMLLDSAHSAAQYSDKLRDVLAARESDACEGYNVGGAWVDCGRPMPHAHGILADMED